MQSGRHSEYKFDLTGGHPALDLANTVSRRHDAQRRSDHLASYADLLAFATQSGIVSAAQANEIRRYAERYPAEATRALRKTLVLREAIYGVFTAVAHDKAAGREDLQTVERFAAEALQHRHLAPSSAGYVWEWQRTNSLDRMLWPVAHSAADLLISGDLHTVRSCEAPDCEWLFLDRSRNRSRRWCDMSSCGNRAKARRHYLRARV